jgi:hypothetical protein
VALVLSTNGITLCKLLWNHDPVFKEIEAGVAVPLLMMRRGEQYLVSFI